MNRERLEMLIALLRDVEKRQLPFDMERWLGKSEPLCGTAACALGYAALDPSFRALGLRLEYADIGTTGVVTSIEQFNVLAQNITLTIYPVYAGSSGFEAGMAFFDVNDDASSHMFDPAYYVGNEQITPSDVIEHVEEVIANGGIMYITHDEYDEFEEEDEE